VVGVVGTVVGRVIWSRDIRLSAAAPQTKFRKAKKFELTGQAEKSSSSFDLLQQDSNSPGHGSVGKDGRH
jgi:hypothetical protein